MADVPAPTVTPIPRARTKRIRCSPPAWSTWRGISRDANSTMCGLLHRQPGAGTRGAEVIDQIILLFCHRILSSWSGPAPLGVGRCLPPDPASIVAPSLVVSMVVAMSPRTASAECEMPRRT